MVATRMDRKEAQSRLDLLLCHLAQTPTDIAIACQAADVAIDHGFETWALPALTHAAERVGDEPKLWQMLALLHRGLDEQEQAIEAYRRAARLALADRRIAHGLALTTFEAGLPASRLFETALRLAPEESDVRLGYVASLKAEGRVEDCFARLDEMLADAPFWAEGHEAHARIHATLRTGRELASIDAAIASHPQAAHLHALRIKLMSRLVPPEKCLFAAARAREWVGDALPLIIQEAVAASEAGQLERAEALFLRIGRHDNPSLALAVLRHLIRAERFIDADQLAARLAATSERVSAWAYRQIAWRARGDSRRAWLEQDGVLVRGFDITAALPPLDRLADILRTMHGDLAHPLDQSVRGGTQTDGPLFKRIDPAIRALRRAVSAAVQAYVREMPPVDPEHPLLSVPRDESPRFVGSWSVRLTGAAGGHHSNHIHGMGWLSSALHVVVPSSAGGTDGCLTFGAPSAGLPFDIEPTAAVTPVAGRLILFPSYLWHGVTPFAAGERLTVAFDVARPSG